MMRRSRALSVVWSHRRRAVAGLLLLALLALFAIGCGVDTPQNTFDSKGYVANKQKDVFLVAMWPALVIMIGVLAATVLILVRFRRRSEDEIPRQVHGNTPLELAWTIAPAILLLGIGIPMVAALWDIGRDPSPDAFQVNVEGQQFQWTFEYPELLDQDGNPIRGFSGIGDPLTVPVGREVALHITSIDVIHSFWVPKLAGKLDAIPGRINTMWLQADEPGSFSGQCAEFCGFSHADMRLVMQALPAEDFEAWVDEMTGGGSSASAADLSGDTGG
jgi:cytochrome c oxidase subunit 2